MEVLRNERAPAVWVRLGRHRERTPNDRLYQSQTDRSQLSKQLTEVEHPDQHVELQSSHEE